MSLKNFIGVTPCSEIQSPTLDKIDGFAENVFFVRDLHHKMAIIPNRYKEPSSEES